LKSAPEDIGGREKTNKFIMRTAFGAEKQSFFLFSSHVIINQNEDFFAFSLPSTDDAVSAERAKETGRGERNVKRT
jgi:hypothetical protein